MELRENHILSSCGYTHGMAYQLTCLISNFSVLCYKLEPVCVP